MSSGCPYNYFDFKRMAEVCKIIDTEMNGILCDFDYEQCEHYREARKPIKAEPAEQTAKPEYYQPDFFGGMAKL